jgi:hypothetical protein
MVQDSPADITLGQFTTMFVPSSLLLVWALVQPELGGDLDLGRTKLTIWTTTILLAPALVLYMFRSIGQTVANLAHLYWTAALMVFLVHAWLAIFIIFNGVADTFHQQGLLIAGGNFLLLVLWVLDVVLLWFASAHRFRRILQIVVRTLAFVIFALTLVVLRGGAVQMLGFVFVGVLFVAGLIRLGTHVRATT